MTPLSQKLQELLSSLPASEQLEFSALFEAIYKVRYTGPIVVDFLNGVPRQINLGPPVKLAIVSGELDRTPPADPG